MIPSVPLSDTACLCIISYGLGSSLSWAQIFTGDWCCTFFFLLLIQIIPFSVKMSFKPVTALSEEGGAFTFGSRAPSCGHGVNAGGVWIGY